MNFLNRAVALAPLLIAASGCGHLAEGTRDLVGLNQEPVRTEGDESTRALGRELVRARQQLDAGISEVVTTTDSERAAMVRQRAERERERQERRTEGGMIGGVIATVGAIMADSEPPPLPADANDLIERAEVYYHLGRLTMRSQCEGYMQALATVDSETTFGQDLANNFFDTATVAATVSQSPVIWATGLSATQNSFNSVSGSTERFLLLSESVGALRERVLQRMDDAVGTPPSFSTASATRGAALDIARQSIEAIQRYGAPCTEGGIRQIIADALTGPEIAQLAVQQRELHYRESIRNLINSGGNKYEVNDRDLRLLLLYAGARGETTEPARTLLAQINIELPYLAALSPQDKNQLYYFINQVSHLPGSRLRDDMATLRQELLNAAAQRAAQPTPTPTPTPEQSPQGSAPGAPPVEENAPGQADQ